MIPATVMVGGYPSPLQEGPYNGWRLVEFDIANRAILAMRLPRMTTRRWMIAVALVGVALGVFHLGRLSLEYWRRADQYAGHFIWEGDGDVELEARSRMSPAEWDAYILGRYEEILRWRAQMEAKYRRAALLPWLPVEPDRPLE